MFTLPTMEASDRARAFADSVDRHERAQMRWLEDGDDARADRSLSPDLPRPTGRPRRRSLLAQARASVSPLCLRSHRSDASSDDEAEPVASEPSPASVMDSLPLPRAAWPAAQAAEQPAGVDARAAAAPDAATPPRRPTLTLVRRLSPRFLRGGAHRRSASSAAAPAAAPAWQGAQGAQEAQASPAAQAVREVPEAEGRQPAAAAAVAPEVPPVAGRLYRVVGPPLLSPAHDAPPSEPPASHSDAPRLSQLRDLSRERMLRRLSIEVRLRGECSVLTL